MQLDPRLLSGMKTRALGFPQNFPPGHSREMLKVLGHSEAKSGDGAAIGIGVPQQNAVCLGLSHLALPAAYSDIFLFYHLNSQWGCEIQGLQCNGRASTLLPRMETHHLAGSRARCCSGTRPTEDSRGLHIQPVTCSDLQLLEPWASDCNGDSDGAGPQRLPGAPTAPRFPPAQAPLCPYRGGDRPAPVPWQPPAPRPRRCPGPAGSGLAALGGVPVPRSALKDKRGGGSGAAGEPREEDGTGQAGPHRQPLGMGWGGLGWAGGSRRPLSPRSSRVSTASRTRPQATPAGL